MAHARAYMHMLGMQGHLGGGLHAYMGDGSIKDINSHTRVQHGRMDIGTLGYQFISTSARGRDGTASVLQ